MTLRIPKTAFPTWRKSQGYAPIPALRSTGTGEWISLKWSISSCIGFPAEMPLLIISTIGCRITRIRQDDPSIPQQNVTKWGFYHIRKKKKEEAGLTNIRQRTAPAPPPMFRLGEGKGRFSSKEEKSPGPSASSGSGSSSFPSFPFYCYAS